MPAYKLQGKTDFQGLPISIENRKGSKRHWYDVGAQKEGTTTMKFPYGYIRGTLGTDGDAVDVYIGNDKDSTRVFVVTQNKAPDFKQIDEQKIMLGFDSPEKAKLAYLAHLGDNAKKFFRNMKEMSVDQLKDKLASQKGKLIKGALIDNDKSVRIGDTVVKALILEEDALKRTQKELSKRFKSDAQRKYMYAAADRGEMSRDVVEEFSDKTPKGADLPDRVKKKDKSMTTKASEDLDEVTKALTAAIAGSIANRARMDAQREAWDQAQKVFLATPITEVPVNVGIAEEQPQIGTTRERLPGEPPVVPVRAIHNEVSPPQEAPAIFKACVSCGRMSKSLSCLTCDSLNQGEATPLWDR